jgi:hypothetical protein
MSFFYKILFSISLLSLAAFSHAAIPNYSEPTSYVGTTFKANYSNLITPTSAFSLLGEGGPRNIRINGTLGWLFSEFQLAKISGEFLRQNINYSFFSGNSREWMNQGAVGALYQYNFYQYSFLPQFTLKGGYSSAASKELSTVIGNYPNPFSLTSYFVDYRRIAGSDAGYISPGISIASWTGARVGGELNYDHVRYRRYYLVQDNAIGFGGTVYLNQQITNTIDAGASAAFRQPFNVYMGRLSYRAFPNWVVSADANYVDGKHALPDTYNVGITLSFIPSAPIAMPKLLLKEPLTERAPNHLASWVSTPAIYIPQVLAVPDPRLDIITIIPPPCNLPIVIGTLPNVSIVAPDVVQIPTASAFSSGTALLYSITTTDPGENTLTINPVTGVITVNAPGFVVPFRSITVTVTATNPCGSVSTTFVIEISSD